jgi:Tfp pilus assembly protein PilV
MIGQKHKAKGFVNSGAFNRETGTSLVECIIALLVLLVVSLSVVSVINFSAANNSNAQRRVRAMLLAQERIEEVRNTPFASLTAGTVTQENVISDGVPHRVVRTITDTDVINSTAAPGPELKRIVVSVTPIGSAGAAETISLSTVRAVVRPGPNRIPNPSDD